jgi:CRP-like cAMP-binding protein
MPHNFIRKLECFTRLSGEDKRALERLTRSVHQVAPDQDIIHEGDSPEHVNLILDGWACRYKQLEDGRQQIISFFVPGDICDTHVFVLREMDHSIGTLTPVRLAQVPRDALLDLTDRHPRITRALWWETLVTAAIQREWTVNLGQRTGIERLSHLFCELFLRLRVVGLTDGDTCPLPITQNELADAMGQTSVHVNRTLQEMRGMGLIILKGKRLTILDMDRLQRVALFNPNYLHLGREGAHLNANDQGVVHSQAQP